MESLVILMILASSKPMKSQQSLLLLTSLDSFEIYRKNCLNYFKFTLCQYLHFKMNVNKMKVPNTIQKMIKGKMIYEQ